MISGSKRGSAAGGSSKRGSAGGSSKRGSAGGSSKRGSAGGSKRTSASSSRTNEPHTKKTTVVSCLFCQARRIKCDGSRPACNQCVRRRRDISCEYREYHMPQNRHGTAQQEKENDSPDSGEEIYSELDVPSASSDGSSHPLSSSELEVYFRRMQEFKDMLDDMDAESVEEWEHTLESIEAELDMIQQTVRRRNFSARTGRIKGTETNQLGLPMPLLVGLLEPDDCVVDELKPPPRVHLSLTNPTSLASTHDVHGLRAEHSATGHGHQQLLDEEVGEAAFVVCWPKKQTMPRSQTTRTLEDFPCFNSSWDGGCMLSVYDSDLADSWIDDNHDHPLLTLLHKNDIYGPIASMLSFDSPALAIFGTMSMPLIQMANELADLAAFPVIVRPMDEDPFALFRDLKYSALSTTGTPKDNVGGNTGQFSSSTNSSSVQSGSGMNNKPRGSGTGQRNLGKQRQDDTESSADEDHPPDSPSSLAPAEREIIHCADIELSVLINYEDKGHFLRVITKSKCYPAPNSKSQVKNIGNENMASDPSIEGHVYLETRSSESIQVDVAAGSVGFLANERDYLRTEYLVSLGYDQKPGKFKVENTSQVTKNVTGLVGLAAGKPTASFGIAAGKLAGTTTGLADIEVPKPWIVSPQHGKDNWETGKASYRALSINIHRSPIFNDLALKHFRTSDITVEYGVAVEVAERITKKTHPVAFVYRHQIHCWVAVESRAKVRGMIVLTAHYIPDTRTETPLYISSRPIQNIICRNTNKEGNVAAAQCTKEDGTSHSNSEDRFIFGTAITPESNAGARSSRPLMFFKRPSFFKGGHNEEQVEQIPIRELVGRGWNRRDAGWDHKDKRWYHPVWPKLGCALLPDESNAKWKLDWKHEEGLGEDVKRAAEAKTSLEH